MKTKSNAAILFEFWGEGGGVLGVWVIWFVQEFFSPTPLVIEFSPDMQRGNIFSSVICHERYFFQCRNIFRRASPYKKFFPLEISLYYIFLWNHSYPLPPQKSNGRPITENELPEHGFENNVFSIFKKSIIIHKQKTKEINVECVFLSDKDRTKLYVHFFRPK